MPGQRTQRKDEWVARFIQLSSDTDENSSIGSETYFTDIGPLAADEQLAGARGLTETNGSGQAVAQTEPVDEAPFESNYTDNIPVLGKGGRSPAPAKQPPKPAKSHSDPLRNDPKIAALLDERQKIEQKMRAHITEDNGLTKARQEVDAIAARVKTLDPRDAKQKEERSRLLAECERMIDAAVSDNSELAALGDQHEQLTAKLEKELERLNKQGMSPQQRGSEYKDEEKKAGWRADIWTAPSKLPLDKKELFRESTHLRTEYYDAESRDASELQIGLDGKIRRLGGDVRENAPGENVSEMVINPETGKMHEFKPNKRVLLEKGQNKLAGIEKEVTEFSHHSSVLGGKEVAGAGSFMTNNEGNLTQITNKSGHYKPGISKLIQSVELLLRQGAFLDRSWTGGGGLSGDQKELFSQTKKAIKAASELQVDVRRETLAMNRELDQNPNADVDKQAKAIAEKCVRLKKQMDTIAKAEQVLAKLGVSHRNKMTGNVEYLDVNAKMTGAEVREATTKTTAVDDFLMSGGGNYDAESKKKAVLTELKAKTSQRRGELDAQAETSGTDKLPHDIESLLQEFKSLRSAEGQQGESGANSAGGVEGSNYSDLKTEFGQSIPHSQYEDTTLPLVAEADSSDDEDEEDEDEEDDDWDDEEQDSTSQKKNYTYSTPPSLDTDGAETKESEGIVAYKEKSFDVDD